MYNQDVIKNLNRITKKFDEMNRNYYALIKHSYTIEATIQALNNATTLTNNMQATIQALNNIHSNFNLNINLDIINFISNLNYSKIHEKYKEKYLNKYSKDFDLFIRENGWIIPNFASEEFIDSLHDSFIRDESINQLFVDYFSDHNYEIINKLKEKWFNESLIPQGNLNIIISAADLIINNNGQDYPDIIIPPLLAQIDLTISQILLKYGFEEKNRKYYSEIYDLKDYGNIRTFNEGFAINIIDNWEEHHVKFLLDGLFDSNDKPKLKNPYIINFNRHDMMHGLNCDYGTFENVIRCLLVIDFLNDFLSDDVDYRLN